MRNIQKVDFTQEIWVQSGLGSPGVKNGTFVNNFITKIDHFLNIFFEILEGARRGEKRWMRTSEIAGCYGRENHFEVTNISNYDKHEENGRQIIRKCEILKQRVCLDRNNLTKMITTRGEVVQSDTKRPKVENMERRPVIIKHRTQRASGRQIIHKCEILKQKTTEGRKRIKNLGSMKKGNPKSPNVSNGSAATKCAKSRKCGDFRFKGQKQ